MFFRRMHQKLSKACKLVYMSEKLTNEAGKTEKNLPRKSWEVDERIRCWLDNKNSIGWVLRNSWILLLE